MSMHPEYWCRCVLKPDFLWLNHSVLKLRNCNHNLVLGSGLTLCSGFFHCPDTSPLNYFPLVIQSRIAPHLVIMCLFNLDLKGFILKGFLHFTCCLALTSVKNPVQFYRMLCWNPFLGRCLCFQWGYHGRFFPQCSVYSLLLNASQTTLVKIFTYNVRRQSFKSIFRFKIDLNDHYTKQGKLGCNVEEQIKVYIAYHHHHSHHHHLCLHQQQKHNSVI